MSYLITHTTVVQDGEKVGIGTTPSHKLDVDGDLRVRGNDIRDSSGNVAITFDGSSNVSFPNDVAISGTTTLNTVAYTWPASDGSSGQFLSTDSGGNLSWASAGGGGSSKATFVMRLAGRFVVSSTNTSRMFTHSSGMGNALGGDFSTTKTEAGTGDTTFTTTAIQGAYYYTIGVAPFACTLDTSSMWIQFRYTYTNSPAYRVWKGTYTNGSGGDITWTEVVSAQTFSNSSTTDACDFSSTTLSSGNSFAAGDLVGVTFQTGGSSTSSSNLNQFTATFVFTET